MANDTTTARDALRAAYRRHVGRGPGKLPVATFAETAGLDPRTARGYADGSSSPSLEVWLTCIAPRLPAAYVNEVLAIAGYEGARPVDDDGDANPHRAMAETSRRLAFLADALGDGHFDHRERRAALVEFRELVAALNGFVRGLEVSIGEG